MITNDVQYRTAKAQVHRLSRLLDDVHHRPLDDGGKIKRQLELDAVGGQIDELQSQLHEYDALREGHAEVGTLTSVDDLPRLLVRARIAGGLSQRELAARLGLKEQQIQRYEATQYASASLSRLRDVAAVLGVGGEEVPESVPTSKAVVKRLTDLGLDSAFVRRRLAPAAMRDRVDGKTETGLLIDLASRIGRVFGMDTGSLLAGAQVRPDPRVLAAASFKLPKTTDRDRVAAYTVYCHYLALVLLQATTDLSKRPVPETAAAFRSAWQQAGSLGSFKDLLSFVWDLGIPVLPLADSGAFHAAVWRASARDVIVVKQGHRNASRWTFDLLHEIGHVLGDLADSDGSVIDGDDTSLDESEQRANHFAGDVLLNGRAEAIVEICVQQAHGSVERLKATVPRVAAAQGVDVGALANYLAFRLSMQDVNWWGAATNLQPGGDDPWEVCRDMLVERANLSSLNPLDRELLSKALVA
jgi:transcriptional regulator with XRE-family HTH domain